MLTVACLIAYVSLSSLGQRRGCTHSQDCQAPKHSTDATFDLQGLFIMQTSMRTKRKFHK